MLHGKPGWAAFVDMSELATWGAKVGTEVRQSFGRWMTTGFLQTYLAGRNILDVGYRGYGGDAQPILPWAIGVDLDYPGYDGTRLPFDDGSQDAVFSSHVLEHIDDYRQSIADWFRVIRTGGFLVIIVPHQFLYERKLNLPSRWNGDHKRFYTAGRLLAEVERSLDPASFRVRHMEDNDYGFDYSIPPDLHAGGCYEIVLVVQKINRPDYADEMLQPELASPKIIWPRRVRRYAFGLWKRLRRKG